MHLTVFVIWAYITLSELERAVSRSHRFQKLISLKAAELGRILLLNTHRKSYIGSPKLSSRVTLKGQS